MIVFEIGNSTHPIRNRCDKTVPVPLVINGFIVRIRDGCYTARQIAHVGDNVAVEACTGNSAEPIVSDLDSFAVLSHT